MPRILRELVVGCGTLAVSIAGLAQKSATVHQTGETTLRIALPDDLMTTPESRRHLIIWAQEMNLGPVLAVDTLPF
jgi:hypothetical protein